MKLKPLADRVVIKQAAAEEKTKGGIILTSAAQEAGQYSGTRVKLDGEEYVIVRQSDILAVVEE